MQRKALETGISGHMCPVGERGSGSFTIDFNRWVKVALELELRSLKEFCKGNLWEGYSIGKPLKKCQVRLLKWSSVSIGAPLFWKHDGILLS
jgi:hypothetical protein